MVGRHRFKHAGFDVAESHESCVFRRARSIGRIMVYGKRIQLGKEQPVRCVEIVESFELPGTISDVCDKLSMRCQCI